MAFIAAAAIGGGLGLAGAYMSSQAAGNAADKQAAASEYAANLQKQEYDQQRADQQPWRDAGVQALSGLSNPDFQKDFSMGDFQQDPGYQFRMQQGQDAIQRSAAAAGGLQNGGTLRALTEYGQNFASNEYNNAYNRFNNDRTNRFNRLSSIAGLGQNANAQMGQAGQNYANQVGGIMTNNANAQGAAGIAQANAWSGALSGIGNNVMMGSMYGAKLDNNWMNTQKQNYGNSMLNSSEDLQMPALGSSSGYGKPIGY